MRPRIFSLMLTAFALVIVLGIGGMSLFFWIAVTSFERDRSQWPGSEMVLAQVQARQLADYYAREGSWRGVEDRFSRFSDGLDREIWRQVVLRDVRGEVVASAWPDMALPAAPSPPAPVVPPEAMAARMAGGEGSVIQSLPIWSEGRQVGTLMVIIDGSHTMMMGDSFDGRRTAQGFLSAGLALTAILLALAAFFSGRISRPLRQLTGAARALAAGDLSVRVRPAAVREVGELAGAFNGMADSLLRADQQRRQLTADVAHELRTPLSIIKGRLEGIQDGVYEPSPGQIGGLLDEVSLLERLIEDLRVLALADAGQLPLYPEPVEPESLLYSAQRSFSHTAADRGVALEVYAAEGLPEISVDTQRIAQVLGNLVGNALRFTPAGGVILLSATLDHPQHPQGQGEQGDGRSVIRPNNGQGVCFAVKDTGAGIAPEDLPHVFDRFYRADRARTRSSGGAGLGLAIARRIVEAHGGRIWAESEPGQGTTVLFTVPIKG